jgi:serine/threonine protein kinase
LRIDPVLARGLQAPLGGARRRGVHVYNETTEVMGPIRETGVRRPTLSEGDRVGRYRIIRLLGVGATGEVFLGVDDSLGRQAAIKLLGVDYLGDAKLRARFLGEARALARLNHPHLITIYEAGEVGERPYFAMELLEGGDTRVLLNQRGALPSGVAALIGAHAASGLAEAARAGIVHRDVKPANLGITAKGVLKVTDFGIAKSPVAGPNLTETGKIVGTVNYIAPEQARGEVLDQRADVYALGCTLYCLLTGRPPFQSGSLVKVMAAHISAPVPNPRAVVPDIDEGLATLVQKCMQKSRDQRPTLETLELALTNIHRRLGGELPRFLAAAGAGPGNEASDTVREAGETIKDPSPTTASLPRMEKAAPQTISPESRRRRWRPATVAVTLAALAVGASLLLLR